MHYIRPKKNAIRSGRNKTILNLTNFIENSLNIYRFKYV